MGNLNKTKKMKKIHQTRNLNNTFSMFLVCDKIMHLCRLCFPGPYDTGKWHLPTNRQGGFLNPVYTVPSQYGYSSVTSHKQMRSGHFESFVLICWVAFKSYERANIHWIIPSKALWYLAITEIIYIFNTELCWYFSLPWK